MRPPRWLQAVALLTVLLALLAVYLAASRPGVRVSLSNIRPSPSPSASTEVSIAETPSPMASPTPGHKVSASGLAGFFAPDFSGKALCKFSHQMATVAGSVLTITYPKGSSAPSAGAPYGGAQVCVPFASGPTTDATLTYQVRFPVGFQFVKGGKLPGLYGGKPPFSGGKHSPYGWSLRLMWRESGIAEVYAYVANSTGYGEDWTGGGLHFQADGQWHTLAEHVHLNSPGRSDGWVSLSYDGTEYIRKNGVLITTTATRVTGLYFSTFYGGHDSSWAPTADMRIDFAGFRHS